MGQKKYPPLTPREIEEILITRGFCYQRSKGDHNYFVHEVRGKKKIVQIDTGNPLYENEWIKLVIIQSGMTREQFYSTTKKTAKKVGLPLATDDEIRNWAIVE